MERLYYVETDGRTSETSSRIEAERIRAEWERRGYDVSTVAVDASESAVEVVENGGTAPARP